MTKVPLSRVFVNDEVRDAGMRAINYVCDPILEFFGKK
jgi:hypothetical protein